MLSSTMPSVNKLQKVGRLTAQTIGVSNEFLISLNGLASHKSQDDANSRQDGRPRQLKLTGIRGFLSEVEG